MLLPAAALVVLLCMLAAAPSSRAGMETLSEEKMANVTGSSGITVDASIHLNSGYILWEDSDGYPGDGSHGYFTATNFHMTNDAQNGPMSITGLDIDVGTDAAGNTMFILGGPNFDGVLQIGTLKIGSGPKLGTSYLDVEIKDLDLSRTTLYMWNH